MDIDKIHNKRQRYCENMSSCQLEQNQDRSRITINLRDTSIPLDILVADQDLIIRANIKDIAKANCWISSLLNILER